MFSFYMKSCSFYMSRDKSCRHRIFFNECILLSMLCTKFPINALQWMLPDHFFKMRDSMFLHGCDVLSYADGLHQA